MMVYQCDIFYHWGQFSQRHLFAIRHVMCEYVDCRRATSAIIIITDLISFPNSISALGYLRCDWRHNTYCVVVVKFIAITAQYEFISIELI